MQHVRGAYSIICGPLSQALYGSCVFSTRSSVPPPPCTHHLTSTSPLLTLGLE